jgi:hypothetical protein
MFDSVEVDDRVYIITSNGRTNTRSPALAPEGEACQLDFHLNLHPANVSIHTANMSI